MDLGVLTLSGEESDGGTLTTGTGSTSDSVDVVLRIVWVVIVEHVSDVLDVFRQVLVNYCQ